MSSSTHHISSDKILLTVAGALFCLTLLTAGVHFLELPQPWSIIAAMTIAVMKGSLVVLFFMGLYWDKRFNAMLLIASLAFFGLLVGYSLLDILTRPNIIPGF